MGGNEAVAQPLKKPKTGSLAPFLAGTTSGFLASITLQPLDVVKTRMQAAAVGGQSVSMLSAAKQMVAKEGVRSLWAGVGPACIRLSAGAGLYFVVLNKLRQAFDADGNENLSTLQAVVSGAASRTTAAMALCPVTVVKTRMEYAGISGVTYSNTASALVHIARTERLKGLFSGLGSTIMRDAPFSGLYLLMYTRLKKAVEESQVLPPNTPPYVLNLLCGAFAGGVATLATHPPDVVRARHQLKLFSKPGAAAVGSAGAGGASLLGILRNEGVRALWVGAGPRVARRTVQMAMTWAMYEELVQYISSQEAAFKEGRGLVSQR